MSRCLPFRRTIVGVMSEWAIALRSIAWIHAEYIADRFANHYDLEARLWQALLQAGRQAARRWWILGIPVMHTRRMNRLGIVAPLARMGWWATAAAVLLLLTWLRRDSTAEAIRRFGEDVAFYTHKTLMEDERDEQPVVAR